MNVDVARGHLPALRRAALELAETFQEASQENSQESSQDDVRDSKHKGI
jgi:hypothetical protein